MSQKLAQALYGGAKRAVANLFQNTSLRPAETRFWLEMLLDEIKAMIETLPNEGEKETAILELTDE